MEDECKYGPSIDLNSIDWHSPIFTNVGWLIRTDIEAEILVVSIGCHIPRVSRN